MGAFIAFEGIDGSGKTTIAKRLACAARDVGIEVVLTREPGGTAIGEEIRGILLNGGSGEMVPETEALLFAAARAQHVAEVIGPALARGDLVIIDRFVDSSLAYQWGGRGLQRQEVEAIQQLATKGLSPDLKFLFDLPVEQALRRRLADEEQLNRLDNEAMQFHERVRAAYRALVTGEEHRWRVINAARPPDDVWHDVAVAVNEARILPRTIT